MAPEAVVRPARRAVCLPAPKGEHPLVLAVECQQGRAEDCPQGRVVAFPRDPVGVFRRDREGVCQPVPAAVFLRGLEAECLLVRHHTRAIFLLGQCSFRSWKKGGCINTLR